MITYKEWKELMNIFNWAIKRWEKGGAFDDEWSSVLVVFWVVGLLTTCVFYRNWCGLGKRVAGTGD
jgi:hypothetical protein